MMNMTLRGAQCIAFAAATMALPSAQALSVAITAPGDVATAVAAAAQGEVRVRAGGTGFETAIIQGALPAKRTGNFAGNNALVAGDWRNFEVNYDVASGVLTLKVDHNDNGSFGGDNGNNNQANETLSWDLGTDTFGFQYIDLYYRGSGSNDAEIRNLIVDGTSQSSLDSSGANFSRAVYGRLGGGYFGNITITGEFDLTGVSANEIPSFGVVFRGKGAPTVATPDGGHLLGLLGAGLLGVAALRRKS